MVHTGKAVESRPPRTAIWLSLVFPGAGQVYQKRWIPAVIFLVSTTVCLFLVFGVFSLMVFEGIQFLSSLNQCEQPPDLHIRQLLVLTGVVILIFLAGLVDTVTAYFRQIKEFTRHKIDQSLESS